MTPGGDFPSLIFIVDPIDNTDGALHGEPAFAAISVYNQLERKVIAAAVADPALSQIYYADEELLGSVRYKISCDPEQSTGLPLYPTSQAELSGAFISIYTLKPERFIAAAQAKHLITELGQQGRIECLGGAAALCRVAAGYIDAVVEFGKGFQTYDLFPGAYILEKAKGICRTPENTPVKLSLDLKTRTNLPDALRARQIFIGAATHELFFKISRSLARDGIGLDNKPVGVS